MSDPGRTYDFIKNKTCPYCQSKLKQGADFIVCSNCGTPHHKECWNENLGCTTYGCINNPLTDKKVEIDSQDVGNQTVENLRASLQTPRSQNFIKCPNCKSEIEEGSVYCKFCGYNVAENKFPDEKKTDAKKEFEKEFKKRYKEKISVTRKRLFITIGSFTFLIAVVTLLFYLTVNKLNEYFSSDEYVLKGVVNEWRDAWQDKDFEKYKSYLTEDYTYYGKDGRKIDLKEKLRRIEFTFKNYKKISIDISDFKVVNDSTTTQNNKKVKFIENYESEKFKERGMKTLSMIKDEETGGEWKIYREIFE